METTDSGRYERLDRLAEEVAARCRAGERPTIQEYVERHPDLADDLRDLFPALVQVEEADEARCEAAAEARPPALSRVGEYTVVREVGRGGMGVVYEAVQEALGRRVALKVLPPSALRKSAAVERFKREARAAARLHHTNIVPIFGVGEHDGMLYYVMQFIQGLSLDAVLDELKRMQGTGDEPRPSRDDLSASNAACSLLTGEFTGAATTPAPDDATGKLSDSSTPSSSSLTLPAARAKGGKPSYWRSVASIGVQVAEALEYAHRQGVLHRDIKPSNLLLDTCGTVWVADFGLARTEDEDHLTHTGDIVGTLRYLPPEAFEGRIDRRSDQYALGLTLYELLTLRPAFEDDNRRRLFKRVTTEEPARLERLNPQVPRDLATIIHKAIDRDPARRYATAGELAADLQRFLDEEPIRARRASLAERLLRWGSRNKALAALSSVALLLLLTVAAGSTLSALRLLAEQNRANQAERRTLSANVKSLLTASPDSVPFLLDTLKAHADEVLPALEIRERQLGRDFVPRLRLNVALAVLGQDRHAELCAAAGDTPPAESFNLLLGLKSGDVEAAVADLSLRYSRVSPGEERTRLAIALLELGDPRAARAELALKPNPTARVRFIHRFATWHGDLAAVPGLLRAADDPAFRSGLCLAVAGVENDRMAPGTLDALDEVLTHLYTSAPDGGTHAAADLARRRRGLSLPVIPPTPGPVEGRGWFVNRLGMTLVYVGPGWFHPNDYHPPASTDGLPPQTIVLTRPIFMGNQEVTAAWYRQFLDSPDHPVGEELTEAARRVDLSLPLALVDRHSGALFCNWLSRAERRTPCYRPAGPGRGLLCDFTANGYRLPTDAEWEYAFRGGTTTRFVVGDDVGRMLEYGRIFATEPGPGKWFFPNPLGLFDMLGNGWDMCWDQGVNLADGELVVNPVGAAGSHYAMRGGAAEAGLHYMHGSFRLRSNGEAAFRVVCGPLRPREVADANAAPNWPRLLEQYPKLSPGLWAQRGRLLAELERYDEAAEEFATALASQMVHLSPGDEFARWDEIFPRLVKLRPQDGRLWNAHMHWLARRGRWREAAAASARLTEIAPAYYLGWYFDSILRLRAGDVDGYRRICQELLRRYGDSADFFDAERTVKTCLLLTDPGADLKQLSRMADRAVVAGPRHHGYRWFLFCKALADHRAGRFDAAIQSIQKMGPRPEGDAPDANAYLLLALSEHGRGRTAEARQALARARALRERFHPHPELHLFLTEQWSDWLRFDVLNEEAREGIEGKKARPK